VPSERLCHLWSGSCGCLQWVETAGRGCTYVCCSALPARPKDKSARTVESHGAQISRATLLLELRSLDKVPRSSVPPVAVGSLLRDCSQMSVVQERSMPTAVPLLGYRLMHKAITTPSCLRSWECYGAGGSHRQPLYLIPLGGVSESLS
jgi:hypothetical protein